METDIQTDMQTSKVKRAIYKLILFFSVYFVVSKIFCCLSVTISNRFASMPICTLYKITPSASYSICIYGNLDLGPIRLETMAPAAMAMR